ncbi:protein hedgehog [Palaemon carinicauda]|uniref:protein hedgehog n=1 Tax=Palaemon carinicauda TaxID=392227 RepID=UPI0035B61F2F
MTPSGPRPVSTLKEGDEVQVMKSDGTLAFSPVLMFLHKDPQASRLFLQLRTSKGKMLTLTSSHLVFVLPRDDAANKTPSLADALTSGGAALAARIEEGDFLLVRQEGGDVALEEVLEVTEKKGSGVFAPLTSEGTVVVDGVVASCYAVIDSQKIAHWAFFPVRFYNNLKETILSILRKVGAITMPIKRKTEDMINSNSMQNLTHTGIIWKEGSSVDSNEVNLGKTIEKNVHIHWYARFLYTIASWLLPAHLVYS